ncbi:Penicillin-binding transpeptidase [uncultured Alphaproteobacteria bacterium]|uniref:peptidoglycan glycosyltransferase n=1 Tax=uncultured Alphaproteobacteria bacterium TaxID=91750 RepID=A0A212JZD2_9PROT|nr:Penicillin-binding transpeptidase [uncultured Alphaproteobacteria bacterium]
MRRRTAAALGCAAVVAAAVALDRALPPDLSRYRERSTVVRDADGGLLRAFAAPGGAWRIATAATDVDPLYLAMLKAVEDRRFDVHPGVDPLAAARAAMQAATNGRIVSGASTLSMQAARLLAPKPRTFAAKAAESLRALQLTARLGREGVLGLYLTLAPFGGALEGATAASLAWFGKPPLRLSPAEAALLVALPQSPERLRPDRHPEAAAAARNRVLARAAAAGVIGDDVARAAAAEPVPTRQAALPRHAPHLAERLAAAEPPGAEIRTRIDGGLQRALERLGRAWGQRLEPGADLAVVVLANRDRRLLAHLGSADWRDRQLDLSRALRSPGSALKPFVYALAFDDLALHPGTVIDDAPQRFGAWLPRNFDRDSHGEITAREALQRSLNLPAVRVLDRVGPARFALRLEGAGAHLAFPDDAPPDLPLALGGVGVRLEDLAMLMAALADGGRVLPVSVLADEPPPRPTALVGEAAARAVIDILADAPSPSGVARGRGVDRTRRVAFKTGTSYGFRDAWTIGASADHTVAVWVGRPDGAPRPGETGLAAAAPLLFRVFDLLPPDHAPRPPPAEPDHALFRNPPPPGLARFDPREAGRWADARPLRVLFPPDRATVESLPEGVGLSAEGGRPPYRWVANDRPLAAEVRFWRPDGEGFARLAVTDADGRRAAVTVRVVTPGG